MLRAQPHGRDRSSPGGAISAAGESALRASERFLLSPSGLLAGERAGAQRTATMRMIASSPALLAREGQVFARSTGALAALLAAETGAEPDDARPGSRPTP